MLAIGLMSGTSLDGVDACLVEIKNRGPKFSIKHFSYLPYSKELKNKLLNVASNKEITIQLVCSLNVELSKCYEEAIKTLLFESDTSASDIEFIAMHGQTVWHNPENLDGYESSTLQLGDPSILANSFNCKVVSNFRSMDMAAGGSGAPLVPFANYVLYTNKKESIALQNIGGIGNVTYLKAGGSVSDIIAFDTGPGNMLIDAAMKRLFGKDYDKNGAYAKKGTVNKKVLADLLKDPYLYQTYPKSTGREKYNEVMLSEVILKVHASGGTDYDVISTLSAYTADTICLAFSRFIPNDVTKLIVTGGGAYNGYIIDRLKQKLPFKVVISNDTDSIEALSFAILGYYTLNNLPSNVPNVTGACKEVVLGNITNPLIRGKK